MAMKPSTATETAVTDVELRLLRVFVAVVDCGGIAAAERALDIGMSTISRQIQALESRLGLVLCRRGRAGFALTPEGAQVDAAARELFAAAAVYRSRVLDAHEELSGHLHVAIFEKTSSNPQSRISEAVAQFRRDAPRIGLHVGSGTIETIERGVLEGRFELGVIPEHRRQESLAYDELFGETMLLYAGQAHPWFQARDRRFDWSHLRAQNLAALGYHSPNLTLATQHRLKTAGSASDQEAVAMLVLSGAYVGFLPDHYAEPFVRAGRIRAVAPDVLRYRCTFSCVRRRTSPLVRAAELFHRHLVATHRRHNAAPGELADVPSTDRPQAIAEREHPECFPNCKWMD